MLFDALINLIFDLVESILDGLPVMQLDVDFGVLNGFLDFVSMCLYFIPWRLLLPILAIIIMLQTWRIIVSVIRVVWELLPFV